MGLFTRQTPDKARFKKTKEEGCVVTVSIEVPPREVEARAQNGLVRIQRQVHVAGFRAGKAPMQVIQQKFSANALEDAVEELIRKYVPAALEELKIEPVASPRVTEVKRGEGEPLKLSVEAEIAPTFVPKSYAKIAVKRASYPATDEALAKRLEELRESHARLEKDETAAVGKDHYVVLDYTGSMGGKPVSGMKGEGVIVDMASDENLEGLAKGLEGQSRGEAREIPVKFHGKDAVLTATVKEIKKKILPAVDVDFAKDLGFETVPDLEKALKEVIEKEGIERSEREVITQIEDALVAANRFPLPPSLLETQLESMTERLRKQLLGPDRQWPAAELEKLKPRLLPQAEKELRLSYLLRSIAEKEKLEATDEEIAAELQKSLDNAHSDKQKEELRKLFGERRETISGIIRDRKTLTFLKEKAVST